MLAPCLLNSASVLVARPPIRAVGCWFVGREWPLHATGRLALFCKPRLYRERSQINVERRLANVIYNDPLARTIRIAAAARRTAR